ncbi:MAG: hypothetical protein ABIW49_09580 [Knoellia sp.]
MNDTRPHTRTDRGGIFADPGRIAPSLDKTWRDAFIVELRLLGVPGDQIGDALVTAESYVHDSAETAGAAFGDPKAYAHDIAASNGHEAGGRVGVETVVSVAVGLAGMLAGHRAFSAWLNDDTITITTGDLLGWGVLLMLGSLLLVRLDAVLRIVVERFWLAVVVPLALAATIAGLLILFTRPMLDLAWPPVAALAVIALLVSTVTGWRGTHADSDEIVAPGRSRQPSVAARASAALVLPTLTVLMLLFAWALSRAT